MMQYWNPLDNFLFFFSIYFSFTFKKNKMIKNGSKVRRGQGLYQIKLYWNMWKVWLHLQFQRQLIFRLVISWYQQSSEQLHSYQRTFDLYDLDLFVLVKRNSKGKLVILNSESEILGLEVYKYTFWDQRIVKQTWSQTLNFYLRYPPFYAQPFH